MIMDFSKLGQFSTQQAVDPLKDLFDFRRENERMRPIDGTYVYVLQKFSLIEVNSKKDNKQYPALTAELLITQAIPEKEVASGTKVELFWAIGDRTKFRDVYAKKRAASFVRGLYNLPDGVDVSAKSLALIDQSQPGTGRLIKIRTTQESGKSYPEYQYYGVAQTDEQVAALRAQLGFPPLGQLAQPPITPTTVTPAAVVAAPSNALGSWIAQSLGVPTK